MTKIVHFEIVNLIESETKRPVVLIYALGEDGILYEMSGGRWVSLALGANIPTLEQVKAEAAAQQSNRTINRDSTRN